MLKKISYLYNDKPLQVILVIAFAVRLIAVIFAKGYGMHDDHFGPIQQPYEIMRDYSIWTERENVHGHSIVYPTIHFYAFKMMESFSINDPQDKMLIVRFLHALYSLLIVFFGYKLIEKSFNPEIARLAGWLLALFWLFPFMSVRNLVEMVAVPPLIAGFYYAIRKENKWDVIIAGALFGISFVFRYHVLLLAGGIGLVFLLNKEFLDTIKFGIALIFSAFIFQGTADWMAWGYPFAAFMEYFFYNSASSNYTAYTLGPWYQYILLLIGIFIPPMSFMIIFGFAKSFKKHLIIFLPIMLFFAFHSYYPNKQERFILPIIPLILIYGAAIWQQYVNTEKFWVKYKNLNRVFWLWFWATNISLMLLFAFTYSKKSRIEPLYYISKKAEISCVVIETGDIGRTFQPTFYLNHDAEVIQMHKDYNLIQVKNELKSKNLSPEFVIFYGDNHLSERVSKAELYLDLNLIQEIEIEPSLIDYILHRLNPQHNKNQISFVYRAEKS